MAEILMYTPFIINVHRRRLWKADFSLATLAKGPHLVLCFVMVANNVNAPTANRSAFFQNFIRLRSYQLSSYLKVVVLCEFLSFLLVFF
jgi:hypothetical protein